MDQIRFNVERLGSVSWECIHFTTDSPDTIVQRFGDRQLQVCRVDVLKAPSLLEAIATALQFPSYFGHNWDAMDECLRDLSWMEFEALTLVVENASFLWKQATCDAGMFVGIWLSAAEEWATEGKPFHLVFCI